MKIQLTDLPEATRSRLLATLAVPPQHAFVLKESKRGWAVFGLCVAVVATGGVVGSINSYAWTPDERVGYLLLLALGFVVGWFSGAYLVRWFRSDFTPSVLLNPLYFMRFRFSQVEVLRLNETEQWDVKHSLDRYGRYASTRFSFRFASGLRFVRFRDLRAANALVVGLREFPTVLADIERRQDSAAMYLLDLLFEWRMREQHFPRNPVPEPAGLGRLLRRLGPEIIASSAAVLVFFVGLAPLNRYYDDQLRWQAAVTSGTASAYRIYIASRPDGGHVSAAHDAIDNLYARAAANYRSSVGFASKPGVEAVVRMLEYANRTGHFTVYVHFSQDNEIPLDIDERLASIAGVPKVVSVLPSFSQGMNAEREDHILQRISSSFGKVIPGDILRFAAGQGASEDIIFDVSYKIQSSGSVYYPVSEEKLREAERDWYTGILFNWNFAIAVPGMDSSASQFGLQSEPADLFNVAYDRGEGESGGMTPDEVYGGMADSAFDDFGSKLLANFSVN